MSTLFTTTPRQPSEADGDFFRRVAAEITGKPYQDAWAASEIVVTEGYESPYVFGRKLRELVDDDNATVFRFHTADHKPVYVAFGPTGAAVYDPARRTPAQASTEPDYFAAADELNREAR